MRLSFTCKRSGCSFIITTGAEFNENQFWEKYSNHLASHESGQEVSASKIYNASMELDTNTRDIIVSEGKKIICHSMKSSNIGIPVKGSHQHCCREDSGHTGPHKCKCGYYWDKEIMK
jgi:hypothetical protein